MRGIGVRIHAQRSNSAITSRDAIDVYDIESGESLNAVISEATLEYPASGTVRLKLTTFVHEISVVPEKTGEPAA